MRLDMHEAQTWSVVVGHGGVEVRVLAGSVWMTREGDPEDHVLDAPDAFASTRPGRLVVFALGPARVDVAPLLEHRVGEAAEAAA
jgi:hypothetical protein